MRPARTDEVIAAKRRNGAFWVRSSSAEVARHAAAYEIHAASRSNLPAAELSSTNAMCPVIQHFRFEVL